LFFIFFDEVIDVSYIKLRYICVLSFNSVVIIVGIF
jgi:hypothetical protein